jgi:hypothetical protein
VFKVLVLGEDVELQQEVIMSNQNLGWESTGKFFCTEKGQGLGYYCLERSVGLHYIDYRTNSKLV